MNLPIAHAVKADSAGVPVAVPLGAPSNEPDPEVWSDAADEPNPEVFADEPDPAAWSYAAEAAWRCAKLLRRLALLHAVLLVWVVLEGWPSWLLLLLAAPAAGYGGAAAHRRGPLLVWAAACLGLAAGRIALLARPVWPSPPLLQLMCVILELAVPPYASLYRGISLSGADLGLLRAGWQPPLDGGSPWGCR